MAQSCCEKYKGEVCELVKDNQVPKIFIHIHIYSTCHKRSFPSNILPSSCISDLFLQFIQFTHQSLFLSIIVQLNMDDNIFQYGVDGILAEDGYFPDHTVSSISPGEVTNRAPVRSPLRLHDNDASSTVGDRPIVNVGPGVSREVAILHRAIEQHSNAIQNRVEAWDGRGYDPLCISAKDHISFYSQRKRKFKESDLAFQRHLQDEPIHVLPL